MDEEATDLKPIFHKSFNENILSLSSKISNLTSVRSSQQQTAISDVLSKISELTLELKDASNYLPAYDQKVYSEQLKAVTEELNVARKSVAPRSKFSFKNRRTGTSTASASSDTTPAVSTPQKPASIPSSSSSTSTSTSSNLQTISLTSLTSTHTTPPPPTPQSTILSLSSLTSCIITPPPPSSSSNYFTTTSINTIKSSILILPKITGPAHLTSLKNSVLAISCHQFRLHDSSDLDVYLRCRSRPIIERCKGVRVSFLPEGLKAVLDGDDNKEDDEVEEDRWNQIDDFNWLKEGRPSPNWRVLEEEEKIKGEMWERVLEDNSRVGDVGISGLLP